MDDVNAPQDPPPGAGASGAAPGDPPPGGAGGDPGGDPPARNNNVVLPQSAMRRIKEEQRAKGRQEALQELAEGAGFADVEEYKAFMANLRETSTKRTPAVVPKPPPASAGAAGAAPGAGADDPPKDPPANPSRADIRAMGKAERERERLERETAKYRGRAEQAERDKKALQDQLDARDAEMALREIAIVAGVKDLDYGIRLLTRKLEGMSETDLAAFDEAKYFQELRAEKPYLFGETVAPANTGTGASGTPPNTGTVTRTNAANGSFDARKATSQEYQEHLRKRGLNPQM